MFETVAPEEDGAPEDDVLPKIAPRRVNAGDVWQLGRHRLVCRDALDPVSALMAAEQARMVFCDPPYNAKIARRELVRDGARNVTVLMAQAVVRAMAVDAAKGQHRAQRLFAELLAATETSRRQLHDAYFDKALSYKLEWEAQLRRRDLEGIPDLTEPMPHPEQIVLDMREGTVRIKGPMTREEKELLECWNADVPKIRQSVAALKEALEHEEGLQERASIEKHIRLGERMLNSG